MCEENTPKGYWRPVAWDLNGVEDPFRKVPESIGDLIDHATVTNLKISGIKNKTNWAHFSMSPDVFIG
jgi:hypothetical protein